MADERQMSFKLSLLTLNCWALPYKVGCKHREERIEAISDFLSKNDSIDVVSLQEIWRQEDYELIKARCAFVFPYAHRFVSGVVGSGVVILSKYRILDLLTYRFSVNGYAHHVHRGDWYGGKVVGLARIYIPRIDKSINVYASHVHAEYDRIKDIYLAHRVVQALEITQFIRLTARQDEFAFLLGDLNLESTDLGYRIITQVGNMNDAWLIRRNQDGDTGFTCSRPDNCYTSPDDCRGKRIDYVLFKSVKGYDVSVDDCTTNMGRLPTNPNLNYSDHNAVFTNLNIISTPHDNSHVAPGQLDVARAVLSEARAVIEEGVRSSRYNRLFFLIIAGLLLGLFIILIYMSSWNPEIVRIGTSMTVSFILALVFGFYLWHGVIVLKTEENALKEALEEINILLTQGEQLM